MPGAQWGFCLSKGLEFSCFQSLDEDLFDPLIRSILPFCGLLSTLFHDFRIRIPPLQFGIRFQVSARRYRVLRRFSLVKRLPEFLGHEVADRLAHGKSTLRRVGGMGRHQSSSSVDAASSGSGEGRM